jgi:hypothetical protein
MLILGNQHLTKRSYTWHVTINIEIVQGPKEATDLWKQICRRLGRRGIVAIWVREPTRSGKIHYHIILKNEIKQTDLERAIKESMPARSELGWHKSIQRVTSDWRLAHYITKAKVPGWVGGKWVEDIYAPKRLLFKRGFHLVKSNTIGPFWQRRRKEDLWQEIRDKEKRISEGLNRPGIRAVVRYVFDLLDGTVCRRKIERSFSYHAQSAAVRHWIESLLAEADGGSKPVGGGCADKQSSHNGLPGRIAYIHVNSKPRASQCCLRSTEKNAGLPSSGRRSRRPASR